MEIKWRRMRWTRHVAHMGEIRNEFNILARKHEDKRPLGRPRHSGEDNTLMDDNKR